MTTLRDYFASLRLPPEPLSRSRRRLLVVTTVLVALTRLLAMAKTLWDWDEALFCSGVRSYDVVQHQPHPPGYPLFVLAAKGVHFFVASEFRSLQLVSLAAAMALFPLLFLLVRELRFRFSIAYCAALLYVFLPTVWFYGGTALSDTAAMALLFLSCALLLRGAREPRAYVAGCIVLGIALGVRPQSLLIAVIPLLIGAAMIRHSWRAIAGGWWACALIVIASYAGAALASEGLASYRAALAETSQWVHDVDSFHSAVRPSLIRLVPRFFLSVLRGDSIGLAVMFFAGIGFIGSLVRRMPEVWLAVLLFAPTNLLAWLMLDYENVRRYSLAWVALNAILAVTGFFTVATLLARRFPKLEPERTTGALTAVCVIAFAAWTLPGLNEVRTTDSPPAAAMQWLDGHAAHLPGTIWIDDSCDAFATWFLERVPHQVVRSINEIPEDAWRAGAFYVLDGGSSQSPTVNFVRRRKPLERIARPRYFTVGILPLDRTIRYGEGWYEEEDDGTRYWRWMSRRGVVKLPAITPARLILAFEAPDTLQAGHPLVTITLDGNVFAHFHANPGIHRRSWYVESPPGHAPVLTIETDRVTNLARDLPGSTDTRDLGLELRELSWSPERKP
jgi:hypothetical protein